jgi:hypothetical protein
MKKLQTAHFKSPQKLPVRTLQALCGALLLASLATPVWSQTEPPPAPQSSQPQSDVPDPPDRVGRISELDGKVWIYAPESGEWIAAARNRPLTTGDRLSTEGNGRAEVRIGSATTVRIDGNTELEVLKLDDDTASFQLHSGSLAARLRTREAAREFNVVTAEGRFKTDRTGSYRIDRIDDTSHATAVSGQLQFEGDNSALTVQQGQRVEFFRDDPSKPTQYTLGEPKRDAFTDWVASGDQREDRSVSAKYVSPEMTGVEDLDRYGRWEQSPDYGSMWIPTTVVAGWAPYRMGHWAWVGPWGWTWIDDAPWGFAPFHYGRWVYYRSAWCWTPGRYVARPVYAPALVAWVGGPRVNVSVSIGSAPTVGWFPLGPREVYVPGYRVSPRYVRNVNVTHVTNITNVTTIINQPQVVTGRTHYVNRNVPNAVTVVPASVMERRQPVAQARANDRVTRQVIQERPRAEAPVQRPEPPRGSNGFAGNNNGGRRDDPRNPRDGNAGAPRLPIPPSPAVAARPASPLGGREAAARRADAEAAAQNNAQNNPQRPQPNAAPGNAGQNNGQGVPERRDRDPARSPAERADRDERGDNRPDRGDRGERGDRRGNVVQPVPTPAQAAVPAAPAAVPVPARPPQGAQPQAAQPQPAARPAPSVAAPRHEPQERGDRAERGERGDRIRGNAQPQFGATPAPAQQVHTPTPQPAIAAPQRQAQPVQQPRVEAPRVEAPRVPTPPREVRVAPPPQPAPVAPPQVRAPERRAMPERPQSEQPRGGGGGERGERGERGGGGGGGERGERQR